MHEAKSHWINWLASGIPPTKLHSQSDISIAQSCAVSKSEMSMAGHWTIKLGIQTSGRNKSFQSLVFVLTQLHFGQLVEQSSILDTKFDCPVIRQNSLLFRVFFLFSFSFSVCLFLRQMKQQYFCHENSTKYKAKTFSGMNRFLRLSHRKKRFVREYEMVNALNIIFFFSSDNTVVLWKTPCVMSQALSRPQGLASKSRSSLA